MAIRVKTPLLPDVVSALKAGDAVLLSGIIYTARDAAHIRMQDTAERGEALPFDVRGQVIFYAGPTPASEGRPMGSVGPTTSSRMDFATPLLLSLGLKGMIGKGMRGPDVIQAMRQYPSVYFAAPGGAAALMAQSVVSSQTIAYADLGTEAIMKVIVRDLPLTVAVDCNGNDYYRLGPLSYLNKHD